jgi:GTP-binding protein EngB required for normal cell division
MVDERTVAVLGKLGHGKTRIVNALCKTTYASEMSVRSCTTKLQWGRTNSGIRVIDTPGFYSSEDIEKHISSQILALEDTMLSGIYVVVKLGRADEIIDTLNKVMDFVGDDDIRVILSFAESQSDDDINDVMQHITDMLDLPSEMMIAIGKDTDADVIERFLESTLHPPKTFQVNPEHRVYMASQCIGARQFNGSFDAIALKLKAAQDAGKLLNMTRCNNRRAIAAISSVTKSTTLRMFDESLNDIQKCARELTAEERNVVSGKVELWTLKKREFVSSLEYQYISGHKRTRDDLSLQAKFVKAEAAWSLEYILEGSVVSLHDLPHKLQEFFSGRNPHAKQRRQKLRKEHRRCQPQNVRTSAALKNNSLTHSQENSELKREHEFKATNAKSPRHLIVNVLGQMCRDDKLRHSTTHIDVFPIDHTNHEQLQTRRENCKKRADLLCHQIFPTADLSSISPPNKANYMDWKDYYAETGLPVDDVEMESLLDSANIALASTPRRSYAGELNKMSHNGKSTCVSMPEMSQKDTTTNFCKSDDPELGLDEPEVEVQLLHDNRERRSFLREKMYNSTQSDRQSPKSVPAVAGRFPLSIKEGSSFGKSRMSSAERQSGADARAIRRRRFWKLVRYCCCCCMLTGILYF